ncbi:hypothetical protein SCA03_64780 [Streptomyces cacaoi]|uniref:Uncharacterized protein n=1 Tax=Streptomyces cacaoi TaxID=1898 RepID=A0A4Y3RB63_STRCI|nr:hypothetical protein SCA03_64780 [Streptomyces cacaoi]
MVRRSARTGIRDPRRYGRHGTCAALSARPRQAPPPGAARGPVTVAPTDAPTPAAPHDRKGRRGAGHTDRCGPDAHGIADRPAFRPNTRCQSFTGCARTKECT